MGALDAVLSNDPARHPALSTAGAGPTRQRAAFATGPGSGACEDPDPPGDLFVQVLSQSMTVDLMEKVARKVIPDLRHLCALRVSREHSNPARRRSEANPSGLHQRELLPEAHRSLLEVDQHGDMGREGQSSGSCHGSSRRSRGRAFAYSTEKVSVEQARGGRTRTMGLGTLREGRSHAWPSSHRHRGQLRPRPPGTAKPHRLHIHGCAGPRHPLVEKRTAGYGPGRGMGHLPPSYSLTRPSRQPSAAWKSSTSSSSSTCWGSALPEPVSARLAVHAGPRKFLASAKESEGDTIRRVEPLESR